MCFSSLWWQCDCTWRKGRWLRFFSNKHISILFPKGQPKTSYINASPISFPGLKQSFIATQTPMENSFDNFWQMVIERDVKIIIMLNCFDDGQEYDTYAKDHGYTQSGDHQHKRYWEDKENEVQELENGISLKLLNNSQQRSILKRCFDLITDFFCWVLIARTIRVSKNGNFAGDVTHLEAPQQSPNMSKSKLLVEILQATMDHFSSKSNPIIVHSNNVGVDDTGVFIAIYKLRDDLHNPVSDIEFAV